MNQAAEIERLKSELAEADAFSALLCQQIVELTDKVAEYFVRAETAEARAYTLAVAIMGGEDAPGYADSIGADVLAEQLRKERADYAAW